jgi:hypothetical protein
VQLVGRLCEACGATVAKLGDGDGCGSCDVVVCEKCLKGTTRCPRCQRPLAETRDEAPRAEARGDAVTERGRRQVTAVAVSLVGAVLLVGLLGSVPFGPMMIQLVVLGLLLMQVFRGRGWARWLLAVVSGVAAVGNAAAAISALSTGSPLPLSLPLALVFAWSTGALVLSPSVSRFIRAARLSNP